jgi:hypothetical protein
MPEMNGLALATTVREHWPSHELTLRFGRATAYTKTESVSAQLCKLRT